MANTEKTGEFSAAVRGYHYYRRTWVFWGIELLESRHDFGNMFDMFAINTCKWKWLLLVTSQREMSRVTKFLLNGDAIVQVTLKTTDYRRFKVSVRMPSTIKNHMLMDRYLQLVVSLDAEPKNEVILGSFLTKSNVPTASEESRRKSRVPKKKTESNRDIRPMFNQMA